MANRQAVRASSLRRRVPVSVASLPRLLPPPTTEGLQQRSRVRVAIGFGLSPILVGMAFAHKGIAVGVAGGFVSYLAATVAIGLTLVLPGRWSDFRAMDRVSARWFVLSGILVALSQMTRYMALAVAPVSVVSPIQRLSLVFRIYFGWIINPKHEVFGGRIVAGTVVSLLGAVALSVSVGDVQQVLPLPDALAAVLNWHWSIGAR